MILLTGLDCCLTPNNYFNFNLNQFFYWINFEPTGSFSTILKPKYKYYILKRLKTNVKSLRITLVVLLGIAFIKLRCYLKENIKQ